MTCACHGPARLRRLAGLAAMLGLLFGCGGSGGSGEVPLPDPGDRLQQPACAEAAGPFAPLSTRCQHFVDAEGRVVMLHGINARVDGVFDVTFTSAEDGSTVVREPIPAFDAQDANRMREMGFDLLRLPINWSGIEPEDTAPPTYDAEYLDRVADVVDLCRAAGIFVLLDFHQDGYSVVLGEDGAPGWAVQPYVERTGTLAEIGDFHTAPESLTAFGTFFGDAEPGPTLRSRFAAMAAAVASRFEGDDAVMGFEVFNEPIATTDQLMAFDEQVARAIRDADPARLVVFEPDATERTLLDMNAVPDAPFPLDGAVYAPHVYTCAFGADFGNRCSPFTRETLRHGNETAYEEAMGFGTPLLITEFGYGPGSPTTQEYIEDQVDLHDEYGANDAFWVWKEMSQGSWGLFDYDSGTDTWTERPVMRGALSRPMPERIAGWPRWWRYDRDAMRLELVYDGDASVDAPTQLYVPAPEDFTATYEVSCDGSILDAARDPATGLLDVPCTGDGPHVVVVQGS